MAINIPVNIEPKIDSQSLSEFQSKMDKYFDKLKGRVDNLFDDVTSSDVVDELKRRFDQLSTKLLSLRKNLNYAIASKDTENVKKYTEELEKMQYALSKISETYKYANKDSLKTSGYYKDLTEMQKLQGKIQRDLERSSSAQGRLDLSAQQEANKASVRETAVQAKEASAKMREMTSNSEASVKRMSASFKKLGSIIKESFVSSIKTATTAIKKYFGLLAKAGKSIFNLIKKGFGGGSESSNPLINMFKKGIVFYGVKKLIGELQNFISTTANIGTVAGSAFAQYNGHLASVKENLRTLGTIGATGLIQALTPVLNVLNFITSAAVNAAYAIADLLGFGSSARKAVAGYNAEAKAISGVGAAAKKATIGLQSFDKLNNNESDKGSGGGGGGGIASAIEGIPYEDNKVIKWLKGLFELLSNKKWKDAGEYIADGINSISDALYNLLKGNKLEKKIHSFNDGLTDFFKGLLKIDTDKIGRNVGLLVNKITYAITDLYNQLSGKGILKGLGQKISQFFNGLFDEVDFRQLGQALMVKFSAVFEVLRGFIDDAKDKDLGTKLGTSIKNFILGVLDMINPDEVGSSLADLLNLGFDALISLLGDDSDGVSLGKEIGSKIVGIFNTAVKTIDPKKMQQAFSGILNFFGDLFGSAKDWDTDTLADSITSAINGAVEDGSVTNFTAGITTFFGKLVGLFVKVAVGIDWGKLLTAICEGIGQGLSNLSDSDKEAIATALKDLFEITLAVKAAKWVLSKFASGIFGGITNGVKQADTSGLMTAIEDKLGLKEIAISVVAAITITEFIWTNIKEKWNKEAAESAQKALEDSTLDLTTPIKQTNKGLDEEIGLAKEYVDSFEKLVKDMQDAEKGYKEAYDGIAFGMGKDIGDYEYQRATKEYLKGFIKVLEDAGYAENEYVKNAKKALQSHDATAHGFAESSQEALNQLQLLYAQNKANLKYWGEDTEAVLNENLKMLAQDTEIVLNNEGTAINAKVAEVGKQTIIDAIKYAKDAGTLAPEEFAKLISTDETTGAEILNLEDSNYKSLIAKLVTDYKEAGKIQDSTWADALTTNSWLFEDASEEVALNGLDIASDTIESDTTVPDAAESLSLDAIGRASDGITDNTGEITDSVSKLASEVSQDSKSDVKDSGYGVGESYAEGIGEGTNSPSIFQKITGKIKSLVNFMLQKTQEVSEVNSPSKLFRDEVGKYLTLGIAEGITDEEIAVQDAMETIRDVMMQPFETRDMSKYFDFSGVNDIIINPSVNKAKLASGLAQEQSTQGILGSLSSLSNKTNKLANGTTVINVYLDKDNKLDTYIVNSVNKNVVKGGGF